MKTVIKILGIDEKDFKRFIQVEPFAYIPYIDPEYVYATNYKCRFTIENKTVENQLREPLLAIANRLLPKDIIDSFEKANTREKSGFGKTFKGLFSKGE